MLLCRYIIFTHYNVTACLWFFRTDSRKWLKRVIFDTTLHSQQTVDTCSVLFSFSYILHLACRTLFYSSLFLFPPFWSPSFNPKNKGYGWSRPSIIQQKCLRCPTTVFRHFDVSRASRRIHNLIFSSRSETTHERKRRPRVSLISAVVPCSARTNKLN